MEEKQKIRKFVGSGGSEEEKDDFEFFFGCKIFSIRSSNK
jgi:hypothetical protein